MGIDGARFFDGMELSDGTLILTGYDSKSDLGSDPHTLILVRKPGEEFEEVGHTPWLSSCAVGNAANDRLVIVGKWGKYLEFGPDGHRSGPVEGSGEVEFLGVHRVDDQVYASGTGRTIAQLHPDEHWVDVSIDAAGAGCTEAVAGFADELYAFGWDGEIWRRDGEWRQAESPAEYMFHAAGAAGDTVYAAGQQGVVVAGRGDEWRVIDAADHADIWSVCAFEGTPFFSSINGEHRGTEDDDASIRWRKRALGSRWRHARPLERGSLGARLPELTSSCACKFFACARASFKRSEMH